jgi:hypothetical protein
MKGVIFEKLKSKLAEKSLPIILNLLGDLLVSFGNMLKETANESTSEPQIKD